MCYMSRNERVGVRELRQNLSVYLRRVRKGEAFEVTERGEPVARLEPVLTAGVLERLVAEGRARPAAREIRDLPPPPSTPAGTKPLSELLQESRDDEPF